MRDIPVNGWKTPIPDEQIDIGDYLNNADLASEVSADGFESITNISIVNEGLAKQVGGYDHRLTTYSDYCLSGTAWQTGHMRARLLVSRIIIFVDDSRSGINTSGFCFWNIMILNKERKSHSVMGDMAMDPSNAAAYWFLIHLISMCLPTIYIITKTMSDLILGMTHINNALPNVNLAAACTWHMMVIGFTKNLKHIPVYD